MEMLLSYDIQFGAAYAKLVAQKSKGMPLISFSLAKLANSAASEAMANLSLELFKSYKNVQNLLIKGAEESRRVKRTSQDEDDDSERQVSLHKTEARDSCPTHCLYLGWVANTKLGYYYYYKRKPETTRYDNCKASG